MLVDDGTWYRDKIIEKVDIIVIGAGVIGLACARTLALSGKEVIILESKDCIGGETSSRNSEVIHAGIYYPESTKKAKWCVQGKQQLYKYCDTKNIPYKKIGKLIVAKNIEETYILKQIDQRAKSNKVNDLQYLNKQNLYDLEPELSAVACLFSPSTGIIDSHNFMLSLLGDAEAKGAMLALNSRVLAGKLLKDGVTLDIIADGHSIHVHANKVINASGLYASHISKSIKGINKQNVPSTYFRKGSYFTYSAKTPPPFKHLIYPIPESGGLGIHSTIDLSGQMRFGPDVELSETINYDVDISKIHTFAQAISCYWPNVQSTFLQPGYAGIRPSLTDKKGDFKDFEICIHSSNFIGLYGIESPGLTAALEIANNVKQLI